MSHIIGPTSSSGGWCYLHVVIIIILLFGAYCGWVLYLSYSYLLLPFYKIMLKWWSLHFRFRPHGFKIQLCHLPGLWFYTITLFSKNPFPHIENRDISGSLGRLNNMVYIKYVAQCTLQSNQWLISNYCFIIKYNIYFSLLSLPLDT